MPLAARFLPLALVFVVYLVINALTRLFLLVCFGLNGASMGSLFSIFIAGLWGDFMAFAYLGLPLAAFVLLPPWRKVGTFGRWLFFAIFATYLWIFLFTAVAEFFFWDEFACRFNFVAVDYLVYTTEVLDNIFESYPIVPLIAGISVLALVLSLALSRLLQKPLSVWEPSSCGQAAPLSRRFACFAAWCLGAAALFLVGGLPHVSLNPVVNELSHNGIYTLFSAYRNNQLDYGRFYPVLDTGEAFRLMRRELEEPGASFPNPEPGDLRRRIEAAGPEKRLNVVWIVVESLGSVSLGERTPTINRLAEQGLYLSNLMATGTRTVRGIEALTLSLPPTPGHSIVRRPDNGGLFSAGSVFRRHGYDTAFVYGGYGYFDNMNAFFAGNGFRIVDRASIPSEQKTFANAWGICDEDLFNAALREADAAHALNRPFFHFVLTTSNHRPFTYPDGKVDIASGSNRSGAIKYTDYAIGRFLAAAAERPWFKDSLFVVVGDHTAGSAGKTEIPPDNYAVPCIIYSPAHIAPARVETLCSQIDVAPTLFSLLGWSYDSLFFGKNVLTMPPEEGRAYIGTYQLLGAVRKGALTVLAPMREPEVSLLPGKAPFTEVGEAKAVSLGGQDELSGRVQEAVAPYQIAHDLFTKGKLKD